MTTEPTSDPGKLGEVPSVEGAQTAADNEELHVDLDLRPHIQRVAPVQPVPSTYGRFIKPTMDRILGTVFCLVWLPFLSVLVIAIWLSMGPPAIYTQRRVGKNGRPYTMYKLRTMRADRRIDQTAPD